MIVYGRNSVEEALADNLKIHRVIVEEGKGHKFEAIIKKVRELKIPMNFAYAKSIEKTAKSRKHQGIVALVDLPANIIEDVNTEIDWSQYSFIVALDGITDTGNFGAIIRSSVMLGVDAVVLPNDNAARITPATIKASAGALYKQNIIYVNNLKTFIMEAQASEFFVYGMVGRSHNSILDEDFSQKTCLVIGSEREGMRKGIKKMCDGLLSIPTTERIDSLNASVASAVAMWEVYRKRDA